MSRTCRICLENVRGEVDYHARCLRALAKIFAQIDSEFRQVELIARHNERHFLLNQALSFVGG